VGRLDRVELAPQHADTRPWRSGSIPIFTSRMLPRHSAQLETVPGHSLSGSPWHTMAQAQFLLWLSLQVVRHSRARTGRAIACSLQQLTLAELNKGTVSGWATLRSM